MQTETPNVRYPELLPLAESLGITYDDALEMIREDVLEGE